MIKHGKADFPELFAELAENINRLYLSLSRIMKVLQKCDAFKFQPKSAALPQLLRIQAGNPWHEDNLFKDSKPFENLNLKLQKMASIITL